MNRRIGRILIGASLVAGCVTGVLPAQNARAAYPGRNGRIVFEQGGDLYSIRPDGSDRRQLTSDTHSHGPRWSPSGRLIAFHRAGDIWVMKPDGTGVHRVTKGSANDINPTWSPDGGQIAFSRTRNGTLSGRSLYVAPATGGPAHILTTTSDGCAVEPTWSASGQYVVYWDECANGVNVGGDALRKVDTQTGAISDVVGVAGLPQPSGQVHFAGTGPDVTPDGSHVLFTAETPTGTCGVAITDLSGGGFRFVSTPIDCGVFFSDDPAVSPDGRLLVYTAGNEDPQLDVITVAGSDQCCQPIYETGTNDFPFRPDWQPRP
jgi:Tol biopolymer transport system component